ncbi:solute carrier family 41 member 1-like isoform X6 [Anopheles albimanus]|uniref:SLC41A/MgtE integral membrane domain-containing protein n=1 Tax=Anopheles albimanus TaxID=7167 RepID=A0A8W7K7N2_ANOAL|nr:solute carrier family 41 member 1-like isoform X6 [Anopheles albimanus]
MKPNSSEKGELRPAVTVADGVVVAIGDVVMPVSEGRRRSSTLTTITTTPGSPLPYEALDAVLLECQGPVPLGSVVTGTNASSSAATAATTTTVVALPRRSSSNSSILLQRQRRRSLSLIALEADPHPAPLPLPLPLPLQLQQQTADAFHQTTTSTPTGATDSLQIDMRGATEFYRVDEDGYRPFTITAPGNGDGAGGKVGNHQPLSSSGSLASIITTSIASSEPDHRGGTISSSIGTGSLAGLDEGEPVVVGAKGLPRATRGPGGDGDGGGGGGAAGDGPGSGIGGSTDGGGGDVVSSGRSGATGLRPEKWWQTTIQIAIPFFIAGIGTIGAGIILGRVEHWKVFKHVTELFILVPALLGLKGNLDMCLASRLSTQANLGNMTSKREILHMIVGNIALVQVQAIVAAFIVSIFAISVGAIMNGNFVFDHAMLLTAASMFTATTSCFVLDFVLVAVILLSNRYQMNPDNLATPLAASIGDVVSISLLSFIATQLFENIDTHLWITFAVVIAYFMLLPMWVFIVLRNTYTRTVLTSGWVPVLSALFISGMGGLVLDTAVGIFNGFVVFQPIINGIGGNLVSVQASKISTMLHQSSILGIIPPHINIFELPWKALFKGVPYAKTARILILMSIPGQVLFIFAADYIHMQRSTIGAPFVLSYLLVSTIQIMLLLYIAHVIIHLMWKWKIDPDNSAIPYLTALGDLLGSSFLMLAFLFLRSIGHPYGEEPDEQELVFGLLPSTGATTLLTTASPDNGSFGGGGDAFTTDLITGAAGI